jgi:hypothetical protein
LCALVAIIQPDDDLVRLDPLAVRDVDRDDPPPDRAADLGRFGLERAAVREFCAAARQAQERWDYEQTQTRRDAAPKPKDRFVTRNVARAS